MQVLVAAASRHGATFEIAEAIGRTLARGGLRVAVRPAEHVEDLEPYDAVVVGSAVYVGRWLPAARTFVEAYRDALSTRPTWLFSSGPVGSPEPYPPGDPPEVAALLEATGARGHRVFSGRLDRDELGLAEKVVARAVRAPAGDFRDWGRISEWSGEILRELQGRQQ